MSENLVNKWLKKDENDLEKDKLKFENEKKELISAIENMLKTAFKSSMEDGLIALAKIHHSLFTSAVNGSEKGSNALFHLRTNLNNLILNNYNYDLGIFLIHYSKHWFRLFLILESRAQEYISWVTNKQESPINYRKILSDFSNLFQINYSIIDEKNKYYSSIQLELQDLENQVSIESAKKLRNLIQHTLRMYLTNDDYKEKLQFIAFFIAKSFEHEVTVQELIHEFAKDWFRKSLEFKKWFHIFIENLNPELEYNMYKGYNWMKLQGKPFKLMIEKKI